MPSLYRIGRIKAEDVAPSKAGFSDFLGRIVLMIPSEVLTLYFVGKGFAENSPIIDLGWWGLICLVIVIPARFFGMKEDVSERFGNATIYVNLIISLVAFVVWVLALGGRILSLSVDTYTSSLFILLVSVVGGWFYTGPG